MPNDAPTSQRRGAAQPARRQGLTTCLVLVTAVLLRSTEAFTPAELPTPSRRDAAVQHAKKQSGKTSKRFQSRNLYESGDPTEAINARKGKRTLYADEAGSNAVASAATGYYSDLTSIKGGLDRHGELGPFSSINDFVDVLEERMLRKSDAHFNTLDESPALVLNADYQPLSIVPLSLWSWQDAIKAVLTDRVTVVATYDRSVQGVNHEIPVPSVIALNQYVNQGKKTVNLTRRNMFLRDAFSCQYCGEFFGAQALTFDHVVPRCKGGDTSWENVVAACKKCNGKKRDLPVTKLERIGMRLRKTPRMPSYYELQSQARAFPPKVLHESWEQYLWTPRKGQPDECECC